jgi:hypothetical protein
MLEKPDGCVLGNEFGVPLVERLELAIGERRLLIRVQELQVELHLGQVDRTVVASEQAVPAVWSVELLNKVETGVGDVENRVFAGDENGGLVDAVVLGQFLDGELSTHDKIKILKFEI